MPRRGASNLQQRGYEAKACTLASLSPALFEIKRSQSICSCTSRFDERSRHWAFADLANEALKKLHKVNISDTRPANDDLHILFHQNDRAYIQPDRGHQALRSPGVVLVSLAAAQLIVPGDCGDMMEWDDVVAGYACDGPSPRRSFAWSSILASMEFKVCGNSSRQLPSKLAGLDLTPDNPHITVMNANPGTFVYSVC